MPRDVAHQLHHPQREDGARVGVPQVEGIRRGTPASARRRAPGQVGDPPPDGGEVEVVPQQPAVRGTWTLSRLASPCRTPMSGRDRRQPLPGGRRHLVDHGSATARSAASNVDSGCPPWPGWALVNPSAAEMQPGEGDAVPVEQLAGPRRPGLVARRPDRDGERPRPFRRVNGADERAVAQRHRRGSVTPAARGAPRGPAPMRPARAPHRPAPYTLHAKASPPAVSTLYTSLVSERTRSHRVTAETCTGPLPAPRSRPPPPVSGSIACWCPSSLRPFVVGALRCWCSRILPPRAWCLPLRSLVRRRPSGLPARGRSRTAPEHPHTRERHHKEQRGQGVKNKADNRGSRRRISTASSTSHRSPPARHPPHSTSERRVIARPANPSAAHRPSRGDTASPRSPASPAGAGHPPHHRQVGERVGSATALNAARPCSISPARKSMKPSSPQPALDEIGGRPQAVPNGRVEHRGEAAANAMISSGGRAAIRSRTASGSGSSAGSRSPARSPHAERADSIRSHHSRISTPETVAPGYDESYSKRSPSGRIRRHRAGQAGGGDEQDDAGGDAADRCRCGHVGVEGHSTVARSRAPRPRPSAVARTRPRTTGTRVCQRIDQPMVDRRAPNATRAARARRRSRSCSTVPTSRLGRRAAG